METADSQVPTNSLQSSHTPTLVFVSLAYFPAVSPG